MADKFVKLVNGILGEAEADHGGMAGLGDDDHSQYFNQTRGDARYSLSGHDHSEFIEGSGVARITVGTTAPANPATGDLWVDTN